MPTEHYAKHRSWRLPLVVALGAIALLITIAPGSRVAAAGPICDGKQVTVNMNLGEVPTSGDDVILGTAGNDTISAGAGNDTVCAGHGNDAVYGQGGNDRIWGQSGKDRIFGGTGDDVISGLSGDDVLRGGSGDDRLWGGSGNDRILGQAGADHLWGNGGHDELVGGVGVDIGTGGDGSDKCATETQTSCEARPAWHDEDPQLNVPVLGRWEFVVSWPDLAAYNEADRFEVRVVHENGLTSDDEFLAHEREITIDTFTIFFEAGDELDVFVTGVDGLGRRSPTLKVRNITIPTN